MKMYKILSNYDFASEISVNILGHIFEQSLTDLEELQANIENINFDKTKSKEKKRWCIFFLHLNILQDI